LRHLLIPSINAELAIGNVLELGSVNWTTIRCQLASEIRIIIGTGLVEGGDVAVATATLAVGLGIVCVEVIAARESTVAARHPTDMRLLLGVALHVTLEVLLALESALAAGLLAFELDLLDD